MHGLNHSCKTKEQEKVFWAKTSACRNGTLKTSHTRWEYNFANYAYHEKHIRHSWNECLTTHQQGSQHCSLQSLPHTKQPMCDMFSSTRSSQHNSHFNMPTDSALLMHFAASAYRTDLSAMLSSNCVAATHNVTHSPCTSTCTPHPSLHTFYN